VPRAKKATPPGVDFAVPAIKKSSCTLTECFAPASGGFSFSR
jgi:hypothetical protein